MNAANADKRFKTEFYVFGYEIVQSNSGVKLIVKISFEVNKEHRYISHALDCKEVVPFFESVGVEPFKSSEIPGKSGYAEVEKWCDRYLVKKWIKKGE